MRVRKISPWILCSLAFIVLLASATKFEAASKWLVARGPATQLPSAALGPDTIAVWSGGALLVVQGRFSDAPTFCAFDRQGKLLSRFTFTIPQARVNMILDHAFARGSDGSLAIVGAAYTADSRAASYLARVSPDGESQTIERLSAFRPDAVTVAAYDTIWVAGSEVPEQGTEFDHRQYIIRRYNNALQLIGTQIQWSSLEANSDTRRRPSEDSILLASTDRVAWYSPFGRTYMEFSLDGKKIGQFRTPSEPHNILLSVALCADGGLFVESPIYNDKGKQERGFNIYTLDRTRDEWKIVEHQQEEKWGRLYGCEGTSIASAADPFTISWLAGPVTR